MKCLVVDDSATMRRILRNLLLVLGADEVVEAHDGKQALERCDATVGLVATGWNLPTMSGLELTRTLRANPETANLRIIVVSSRNRKSDVQAAIAAGANDYVLKPFVPETLRLKLEELMRDPPAPEQAQAA